MMSDEIRICTFGSGFAAGSGVINGGGGCGEIIVVSKGRWTSLFIELCASHPDSRLVVERAVETS
jgi:hypothetical protein